MSGAGSGLGSRPDTVPSVVIRYSRKTFTEPLADTAFSRELAGSAADGAAHPASESEATAAKMTHRNKSCPLHLSTSAWISVDQRARR